MKTRRLALIAQLRSGSGVVSCQRGEQRQGDGMGKVEDWARYSSPLKPLCCSPLQLHPPSPFLSAERSGRLNRSCSSLRGGVSVPVSLNRREQSNCEHVRKSSARQEGGRDGRRERQGSKICLARQWKDNLLGAAQGDRIFCPSALQTVWMRNGSVLALCWVLGLDEAAGSWHRLQKDPL